ncbi:MAG TPA: BTAD domain-containing putative transcriptional regulator [Acidimicrobiales bacterium]|nr:BTAD domain-containing putative transcriptional regulator [Acidimicrobiales bacterium]
MRVRVLGAIEISDPHGAARVVGSPNQRRVLVALVARLGQTVSVDTLVDAVWEAPPASALTSLRTYISRLRHDLGESLASRGAGWALDVAPSEVDAGRFEQLVRAASHASGERAVALLDDALALWRGPPFADLADLSIVRAEARRLEVLRSAALESRARELLAAGELDRAVSAAEAFVVDEPLREGGWVTLIRALAATAQPAEALRAYQRATAALAEAGLEPSAQLREAERNVLAGAPLPIPQRRARTSNAAGPVHYASTFVGRDADRTHLLELLERSRVVSLVGPGGVGKTRLAIELARELVDGQQLDVRVVELASLDDAPSVAAAVVSALGLSMEGTSVTDALRRAGELDLILVLDNAEHVIEECATTVRHLIGGGPALRILVTSRERLAVDGEHVWSVAPLATEEPHGPAVDLFTDRARAVYPTLDRARIADVAPAIVRRLDGLPLAIEMAAAQLSTVGLDELRDILDKRLDELQSPSRASVQRHRSLDALLQWSEALLDDDHAETLAALSVFAGSVTLDDIVGVLGPGVGHRVRTLAERSLVSIDRGQSPVRFRLLETVRTHAAARLAQRGLADQFRLQHARWFTRLAESADAKLRTVHEADAVHTFETSFAEIRAAHRWARDADPELAAALSASLHLYAQTRLFDEPLQWAEMLVDAIGDSGEYGPSLLASAATRAANAGNLARARSLAEGAIALAGTSRFALPALEALGDTALYEGHLDDVVDAGRRLADLADLHGDPHYATVGRISSTIGAAYRDDPDIDVDALAEFDSSDLSPTARGWLAYAIGECLLDRAPDQALEQLERAVSFARTVGNSFLEGVALVSSCSLRARVGQTDESLAAFASVIQHWMRLANHTHLLTTLRNLTTLLMRVGAATEAAELLGSCERDDVPTYGPEAAQLDRVRTWARSELGGASFDRHHATGARRTLSEASRWALDWINGSIRGAGE